MDALTVIPAAQWHPELHRWSAAPWGLLRRLKMWKNPWLLQQPDSRSSCAHPVIMCGALLKVVTIPHLREGPRSWACAR
eukprot:7020446-Prymnesium_polylepis.1